MAFVTERFGQIIETDGAATAKRKQNRQALRLYISRLRAPQPKGNIMSGAIQTSGESETAEQRFRDAFERLKDDKPRVLPSGTPVSQNNVAKEAGTDPSALKKKRFPALVREIQAWVEIHSQQQTLQRARQERKRRSREDLSEQNARLTSERDDAQSQLTSAHRLVLELLQKNAQLQAKVDELSPEPSALKW